MTKLNAKAVLLSIAVILFVIGVVMIAIAEHAYSIIFLSGLGMIIVSIMIFVTSLFWKVATIADSFFSSK